MCKYINGMVAGIIVGAAVGMMILPQLDRKTQKTMKRAGNTVLDLIGDSCGSVMDLIHM